MRPGTLDTTAAAGVTRARTTAAAVRGGRHELYLAVAQLVADGIAVAAGYRCTKRFLQDTLRISPAEARHLIDRAALLAPRSTPTGQALPPRLPATAAASAAGALDEGHLAVIVDTINHLETVPGMDPDALDDAEQALAYRGGTLAPAGLATVAHRMTATADPDGAAPTDPPNPTTSCRCSAAATAHSPSQARSTASRRPRVRRRRRR